MSPRTKLHKGICLYFYFYEYIFRESKAKPLCWGWGVWAKFRACPRHDVPGIYIDRNFYFVKLFLQKIKGNHLMKNIKMCKYILSTFAIFEKYSHEGKMMTMQIAEWQWWHRNGDKRMFEWLRAMRKVLGVKEWGTMLQAWSVSCEHSHELFQSQQFYAVRVLFAQSSSESILHILCFERIISTLKTQSWSGSIRQ